MDETIQSPIFGTLHRDRSLLDQTTYNTVVMIPNHGRATVSITALPDQPANFSLRAVEHSYRLLLQQEKSLRKQSGGEVWALHRNYWGQDWRSIAEHELVSILRLFHLNLFSDGTIELWYSGGDPFQCHDVRITLDAEMLIIEVELDG